MAIRVFIERNCVSGNELSLNELLMELRLEAMGAKGYVSGETLRSLDNPNSYLVISTWDSVEDWNAWTKCKEREELQAKIDALLEVPSLHRVYVYG